MLLKSNITDIEIHSDRWHQIRRGRFTSSENSNLMGRNMLPYIRRKVGEEMTGLSAQLIDVETEATRWGLIHEAEGLQKLGQKIGVKFLVTQKLIISGDRFSSTPDAIIPLRESADGTAYDVETVEIKCPPTFDNYLLLFECMTPMDLKAASAKYYWQVLDQMLSTDAKVGHFGAYHPDFRSGNLKHLEIRQNYTDGKLDKEKRKIFPVHNDMKELKVQKELAISLFNERRQWLMEAGKN